MTNRTTLEVKVSTDLEKHKDFLEEKTGIFHWKDEEGKYIPLDKLSKKEIEQAIELCDKKKDELHRSILKTTKYLTHRMEGWQYREDRLQEKLDELELAQEAPHLTEEVSEELVEQPVEKIEQLTD